MGLCGRASLSHKPGTCDVYAVFSCNSRWHKFDVFYGKDLVTCQSIRSLGDDFSLRVACPHFLCTRVMVCIFSCKRGIGMEKFFIRYARRQIDCRWILFISVKEVIETMRDFHTWGGLFFGWLLFIIFFTGTLSVFAPEITYWMTPEARVATVSHGQALQAAEKSLQENAPDADMWFVILPQGRTKSLEISWQKNGQKFERYVHPETGETLNVRQTKGGEFFAEFHYQLHHEPLGIWIVSIAGGMMIMAIFSGIAIRNKVIFDFFSFRWRKNFFSIHTMSGVLTLPFVVIITYTGLVMTFTEVMPVALHTFYKNEGGFWTEFLQSVERPKSQVWAKLYPLAELLPVAEQELGEGQLAFVQIKQPNTENAVIHFMRRVDDRMLAITDRASFDGVTGQWLITKNTWDTQATIVRSMVGLHIAKFGGYPMAWGYFLFGLISSGMIATGLVFFTIKRRLLYERASAGTQDFFKKVESFNVAVVCGCIIAVGAYFWANRLLPISLNGREAMEIGVFFLAWGIMLFHAFWRSVKVAWVEQLQISAILFFVLPFFSAWKTSENFWYLLSTGDWMSIAVELVFFLAAIVLWAAAHKLNKQWKLNHKNEFLSE